MTERLYIHKLKEESIEPAIHTFYDGQERRIVWVAEASGRTRAKEYFEGKFRPEANGIYAFKSGRIRLLCFLDGRDVLLTNGYDKKAEKVRRQEIERATRIRASWRAQKEGEAGRA